MSTLAILFTYIILAHRGGLPELFDYYTGDFVRDKTENFYNQTFAPLFEDINVSTAASAVLTGDSLLDAITREPRYLYTLDLIEAISQATSDIPSGVRDDMLSMSSHPALVEWVKNPRGIYASIFRYEFIRLLDGYPYMQEVAIYNNSRKLLWRRGDESAVARLRQAADWERIGLDGFSMAIKERGRVIGYVQGNWESARMSPFPEISQPGLGVHAVIISRSGELLYPQELTPVAARLFSENSYLGPLSGTFHDLKVWSSDYGNSRVVFFYPSAPWTFYVLQLDLYALLFLAAYIMSDCL